ncbi:hypothetical protein TWF103_008692 [Orbilia oligospora]|nr:hypothetical protein TWF103_008692 [Orbilia oligospora]
MQRLAGSLGIAQVRSLCRNRRYRLCALASELNFLFVFPKPWLQRKPGMWKVASHVPGFLKLQFFNIYNTFYHKIEILMFRVLEV